MGSIYNGQKLNIVFYHLSQTMAVSCVGKYADCIVQNVQNAQTEDTPCETDYTAIVYRTGDTYEVSVFTHSAEPQLTSHGITRKHVFTHRVRSTRQVTIRKLCEYMRWKFGAYDEGANVDSGKYGIFTNIRAHRSWILSIIRAEFDYHVGARECLDHKNVAELKHYCTYRTASFDYQ
jgi:hypothetical protein